MLRTGIVEKLLHYLHGRDDKNLKIRCGTTERNLISFSDLVQIFNEKHKSKSRFYQKNKDGKQDHEIVHRSTNSIQEGTSINFFMASMFS